MTYVQEPACWVVLANQFPTRKIPEWLALDTSKAGMSSWNSLEEGNREIWRLLGLQVDERVFEREIDLIRARTGNRFWYRASVPIVMVTLPTPAGDLPRGPLSPSVFSLDSELATKKGVLPGVFVSYRVTAVPPELCKHGAPIFEWVETARLG